MQDATNAAAAKIGGRGRIGARCGPGSDPGQPARRGRHIAFGVGWLLSALVPVSGAEQQAAKKIEENSAGLVEPLKQSAMEVASNLQEPLQQSAQAVKESANDAASKTADHARSATDDVRSQSPLGN